MRIMETSDKNMSKVPEATSWQHHMARGASAVSLVTAVVCIILLLGWHIDDRRRTTAEQKRIDTLQLTVKKDARSAPELAVELDGRTARSLRLSQRQQSVSNVLILSSIVFLISVKRLTGAKAPPALVSLRRSATGSPGESLASAMPQEEAHEHIGTIDLAPITNIVAQCGRTVEATIPLLQAIQSRYGYVPAEALRRVCELTEISAAHLYGVLTFYPQFRRQPMGRHLIRVCHGTACHVAGAPRVTEALRRALGIEPEATTDPRRLFTVEEVACLGCCTLAPVIQIDGTTYGHMTPENVPDVLRDFLESHKNGTVSTGVVLAPSEPTAAGEIRIGMGSCCQAGGSAKVRRAMEEAIRDTGACATVKRVGCVGMCHQTPLVETVLPNGAHNLYAKVSPEDTRAILLRHFQPGSGLKGLGVGLRRRVDDLLLGTSRTILRRRELGSQAAPLCAFLGSQIHIATEHCGQIDPLNLDEYLAHDGFSALRRCATELSPEMVIDEVRRSGLRGRGGAGYPTGLKWSQVREAIGGSKYVICNGDEGDPGAFMDRMLMESYPYRIIEGLAVAAYAVGATEGLLYIRAEYPLAVERMGEAIRQCEARGLLGGEAFGGRWSLRLTIKEGAGAFVCGEETALLASIQGHRGMPRLRPPYPASSGLNGKPTLVNNVETCAVVPWIIRNGGDAFARQGTGKSRGTKVFALAGKVVRGGLIEVPMGITLRRIVEEIGGGVREGRQFKAVQVGGPSGGCIPAALADTPVDYEALTEVGAIMGSGGLVVLDDTDCMVDIARYFLQFTQNQSCGRCTFCRVGTRRMLEILERLCAGLGQRDDLEHLEHLARMIRKGSLCGLGRTAPNPVLTTLRYFRDEYEAHLNKRCPAGKCRALITYRITDECIGCTLCAQHCPAEAIGFTPYEKHRIDDARCVRCGGCRARCPVQAVEVD